MQSNAIFVPSYATKKLQHQHFVHSTPYYNFDLMLCTFVHLDLTVHLVFIHQPAIPQTQYILYKYELEIAMMK